MTGLATFILSLLGFAALAMAMPRHHRDLLGRNLAVVHKALLRIVGWTLLGASIAPSIYRLGLSIGIVFWFAVATVSALAVAFLLTCSSGQE